MVLDYHISFTGHGALGWWPAFQMEKELEELSEQIDELTSRLQMVFGEEVLNRC
jgi:hypothetical protein